MKKNSYLPLTLKKVFCIILTIAIAMLTVPFAVAANYNGFVYELNDGGTYTITGYTDFYTESVIVPSTISGKSVTAIEQGAFQLKSNIKSVTIGKSILLHFITNNFPYIPF